MNSEITWTCPACPRETATISALSEAALSLRVFNHIRTHERTASLRAVDEARCECRNPNCELGKTQVYNFKSGEWQPDITGFDRRFLHSMKIKWD